MQLYIIDLYVVKSWAPTEIFVRRGANPKNAPTPKKVAKRPHMKITCKSLYTDKFLFVVFQGWGGRGGLRLFL